MPAFPIAAMASIASGVFAMQTAAYLGLIHFRGRNVFVRRKCRSSALTFLQSGQGRRLPVPPKNCRCCFRLEFAAFLATDIRGS